MLSQVFSNPLPAFFRSPGYFRPSPCSLKAFPSVKIQIESHIPLLNATIGVLRSSLAHPVRGRIMFLRVTAMRSCVSPLLACVTSESELVRHVASDTPLAPAYGEQPLVDL